MTCAREVAGGIGQCLAGTEIFDLFVDFDQCAVSCYVARGRVGHKNLVWRVS